MQNTTQQAATNNANLTQVQEYFASALQTNNKGTFIYDLDMCELIFGEVAEHITCLQVANAMLYAHNINAVFTEQDNDEDDDMGCKWYVTVL